MTRNDTLICNIAADLGEVGTEGLGKFREAERGRSRIIASSVGKRHHCGIAERQEVFKTAAEVFERFLNAREIDPARGVVTRILNRPAEQLICGRNVCPQLVGECLFGGNRRLKLFWIDGV